jgi:nicotinate-nucleotide adenylyltransferase
VIAVFGGTFDPIHNAHLEVARSAAASFALEKVLFVPAGTPPHKQGALAPYEDRVRMVELACAGEPRFEVSRIEERTGRSYSVDTIERLMAEGLRNPAFLIGADAFAEIRTWHRWQDLAAMVEFLVVTRPGAAYGMPEGVRVRELPGLQLDVSSSAVRAAIEADNEEVPVPSAVRDWIREHGLYRSQPMKISASAMAG